MKGVHIKLLMINISEAERNGGGGGIEFLSKISEFEFEALTEALTDN